MDLFKLLGTIEIDNKNANKSLDETSQNGEQAKGRLSKAFTSIGSAAVKFGKTVAVGMVAAGTAVAGLVTKSVQSYADYEQLVGGVETLFKTSADKVQEYAKNAYKTAGLSANEYMETVTSFSASLLQSLDNDTAAAAEKANKAITDMADNANKMGTDMSSIQNAYQGFAKSNYTMLDNLKLGYGGTKEEMARLLEDAEAISGIEYDISSYADIVDAIHVIQTEMDITGTTAKEAGTTIQGSFASMKGAWQNLLTAMSAKELPVGQYVKTFVDSVSTVADNLLPRIRIALDGVVQLVNQLAPQIVSAIPMLVSALLPAVVGAATSLIAAVAATLPGLVTAIVNCIPDIVAAFVSVFDAIISALPALMESIVSALPMMIEQLAGALTTMIATLCTMLPQIIQPIIDYLPQIIMSIVNALVQNLPVLIEGLISLVMGIVGALPQIVEGLVGAMPEVISLLVVALVAALPQLIEGAIQLVMGLIAALPQIIQALIDALPEILQAVWDAIVTVFEGLPEWFGQLWEGVKDAVSSAVEAILPVITNVWNAIVSVITTVMAGIRNTVTSVWNGIKSVVTSVVNGIKNTVTSVFNGIKNTAITVWNGIKTAITTPIEAAKAKVKEVVDAIKGFFSGMKLELPKIKLPHFSISGKLSLDPPSVPKLSIDWYAKAMRNPLLMTTPTIFGYNPATGQPMGGGEAGSEVVSGTGTLMDMIENAVENKTAAQMQNVVSILYAILDAIVNGNAEMLQAILDGHTIRVGEREFARLVKTYA